MQWRTNIQRPFLGLCRVSALLVLCCSLSGCLKQMNPFTSEGTSRTSYTQCVSLVEDARNVYLDMQNGVAVSGVVAGTAKDTALRRDSLDATLAPLQLRAFDLTVDTSNANRLHIAALSGMQCYMREVEPLLSSYATQKVSREDFDGSINELVKALESIQGVITDSRAILTLRGGQIHTALSAKGKNLPRLETSTMTSSRSTKKGASTRDELALLRQETDALLDRSVKASLRSQETVGQLTLEYPQISQDVDLLRERYTATYPDALATTVSLERLNAALLLVVKENAARAHLDLLEKGVVADVFPLLPVGKRILPGTASSVAGQTNKAHTAKASTARGSSRTVTSATSSSRSSSGSSVSRQAPRQSDMFDVDASEPEPSNATQNAAKQNSSGSGSEETLNIMRDAAQKATLDMI